MCKRIMLALTFVAAFGLVSVVVPDTSEARRWGRGGRPWVGGYYGDYYRAPRAYYWNRAPVYPRYYQYYGGPRTYVGPPSYYDYYGPRRGVYFSWGF
jgi:hypothetical protein